MKRLALFGWVATAALAAPVLGERTAHALVGDDPVCPPDANHICQGESITLQATTAERAYRGSGLCWFNLGAPKNKADNAQWVRVQVRFDGRFMLQSNQFAEELVFLPPGQPEFRLVVRGQCPSDPWTTGASCSLSTPPTNFCTTAGWCCISPPAQNGPLSRAVYPPSLISGLLQKQLSKPPLAPVDLDVVRWPAFDGSGSIGRVFWRIPDVSGNKWIFNFVVEYAINSSDSAFSNAGQVTGTGETANLSPWQVTRLYYSTFKLQPGDYYFRVCSVNDAGKQCSAPRKAREPTKAELLAVEHSFHRAAVTLAPGGTPSGPLPGAPPRSVGAAPPPVVGLPPRQPMPPAPAPR
jgi:hypothetical protein